MCLRTFICCGWEDESTIIPLSPFLLVLSLGSWWNSWVAASWVTHDVMMHWLQPQTQMNGLPHPLQTCGRCLRTYICCGWTYGSTIITLPPFLMVLSLGVDGILRLQLGYKWCHDALDDASDPHERPPTSTSNICKVFEIIHMLWLGIWIHHHPLSPYLLALCLGNYLNS